MLESGSLAAGNFKVTINGSAYSVDKVEAGLTDDMLVLILKDNPLTFNGSQTVVVETKLDNNQDYHVTDIAENPLKVNVKVLATIHADAE